MPHTPTHDDELARALADSTGQPLVELDSASRDTLNIMDDTGKLTPALAASMVMGRDPRTGKFAQVQRMAPGDVTRPRDLGQGAKAARARGGVPRATPVSRTFQTGRSVGRGLARGARGIGRALGPLGLGSWLGMELGEAAQPFLPELGFDVGSEFAVGDARDRLQEATAGRIAAEEERDRIFAEFGGEVDPLEQALRGEAASGPQFGPGIEEAALPEGAGQVSPADGIVGQFPGARVAGTTPEGIPEAEEMTGLGRSLSQFGKALETPGFQRFLAEMGIAFSGGFPNAPGTILGESTIAKLDADAEARVTQALLSGEPIEDIDFSGLSSEAIRNIGGLAQRETQLGQAATQEERQAGFQTERLKQFDEQLGIQRDRLDLDTFNAISNASPGTKPDDVESFEHGYALDTVGSSDAFYNVALSSIQGRAEELGLSTIQEIQNVLRGDEGQVDPQAVRANLPEPMQREFDRQVVELSRSVSRGFSDTGQTGQLDFTPGLPTPAGASEVEGLEEGAIFRAPGGGTWMKQGAQVIPVDDDARRMAAGG